MTLTRSLAALVRARRVTPADLEQAALFTLDAVANALAGRRSEPGRVLLGWAARNAAPGADAGRHAFLLGGLTHILETDDLHRASVVHPGCVVVPAALALARRDGGSGGRRLLEAVLRGYEATCRVGMAVGPAHYRLWHNTATCGPFGSAVAAAALLGLDETATVHALGNAGTQAAGLWQFLAEGAMSKHLHAARAAEAGVVAAELAALGFSGPEAILEGPQGLFAAMCPDADPGAVLAGAEGPWQLHATSIKPWPSCRHTHPAVDAALEAGSGLAAEQIEALEVETYPAALEVCDRPAPASEYAAKFSLQHCVAAALADHELGFGSFSAGSRARLAPLRARVALRAGEAFAAAYPGAWGAEVRLRLHGGAERRVRREACRGDPDAPLSREERIAKARALLRHGGVAHPEALIEALLGMAADGPVPDPAVVPAAA